MVVLELRRGSSFCYSNCFRAVAATSKVRGGYWGCACVLAGDVAAVASWGVWELGWPWLTYLQLAGLRWGWLISVPTSLAKGRCTRTSRPTVASPKQMPTSAVAAAKKGCLLLVFLGQLVATTHLPHRASKGETWGGGAQQRCRETTALAFSSERARNALDASVLYLLFVFWK